MIVAAAAAAAAAARATLHSWQCDWFFFCAAYLATSCHKLCPRPHPLSSSASKGCSCSQTQRLLMPTQNSSPLSNAPVCAEQIAGSLRQERSASVAAAARL